VPGRLPDAISQFAAALRIDPNNAQARTNLRDARLQLGSRGSLPADKQCYLPFQGRRPAKAREKRAPIGGQTCSLRPIHNRPPDPYTQSETSIGSPALFRFFDPAVSGPAARDSS
jgi:hypothetical protein